MLKIKSDKGFDIIVNAIMLVMLSIFLYPLYFVVIASFSEPVEVVKGNVVLFFKGFTLDSYQQVFKSKEIWIGYKNTAIYTILGTMFAMFMTIPAAYAMSRKKMWKRSIISLFFVIPMYIGGGMLPTYLQVRNLGLINQWYTQIVLGSFSVYNMIVARNYFQTSIPDSLFEAAEIDGASQFKQLFMIALPLAKPIIAVITLYYAVGRWNDYWTSLVYITDSDYFSLQFILREILLSASKALNNLGDEADNVEYLMLLLRKSYLAESMKYSVIFIASLPMLIAYPFVQKHFVKGVMVGSVKG